MSGMPLIARRRRRRVTISDFSQLATMIISAGALLVSMGLALAGMSGTTLPTALTNAAQLVIGVSLGVRFQRDFVHVAPRWLASVALGTLAMMVLSGGFGLFLGHGRTY